ncbi:MAG: hypothetical protein U0793_13685 [Gemmataceae bacterium]
MPWHTPDFLPREPIDESTQSNVPETVSVAADQEPTFKAPLGLKLFLVFFILLGAIILADTVTRFFR